MNTDSEWVSAGGHGRFAFAPQRAESGPAEAGDGRPNT